MIHEQIFRMEHFPAASGGRYGFRFLFCGTTFPYRGYLINRPASKCSSLEYVVRGKGHLRVNGRELEVRAGDTYFLHEGDDQYYYADADEPWEKIWVTFCGPFSQEQIALSGLGKVSVFRELDTSDLLSKLQYHAQHGDVDAAAEKCASIMAAIFCRMSRFLHEPPVAPLSPVEKMRQYIEQHVGDPVTLEQIALSAGKSPSQAERLFRTEVGIPIYRYTLERKMDLACQLLTETGMSVKEIAEYLSFADEFYFSGLFRRKMGVSPQKYRQGEPC